MRSKPFLLGFVLVALGGCGSDLVKDVEKLADQACDCKSRDCALSVNADFSALLEKPDNQRISKSEEDRLGRAVERLTKCVGKQAGTSAIGGAQAARPEPAPVETPAQPETPPAPAASEMVGDVPQ